MSSAPNPYASLVGDHDPSAVLEATIARLQLLAARIGAAGMITPRAPGKWSPRDILCHLADCEIAFGFRLRQTLAEEHHVIQPFDQEKWAAPYSTLTAGQALAAFAALRQWNLLLIESAMPAQSGKPVTHPERGTITFSTIVETMAGHDLNHLTQLEQIAAA